MKKSNIQRLGDTLSDRMVKSSNAAVPVTVELGIINSDMSLSTDSLSGKIDPRDYMIDLRLTHKNYYTYDEMNSSAKAPHHHSGGDHVHDDGLHDHRVPSVFRRLEPGDRVLVLWVGHEPIIVSIIVSGTTITSN